VATASAGSLNSTEQHTLREMKKRRDFIRHGQARFLRLSTHPVGKGEPVKISPPVVDVNCGPS
jgi:hypothetical protein